MTASLQVGPFAIEHRLDAAQSVVHLTLRDRAARQRGDLEVFVNISQMTVSQMSLTETTESSQQRQHFLAGKAG